MTKVKTILLIDEEAVKLGDSLQDMLNLDSTDTTRYRVLNCTDYLRAVSMLDGVDIALVAVDFTIEYMPEKYTGLLPNLDEHKAGYRIVRHMKDEHSEIKSIILATFSGCEEAPAEEQAVAVEKGASGFLIKPFRAMDLVQAIKRLDSSG